MKKIYIRWNSPWTAHELDRTISKLAKYGEKIFAMAAPQNIRTYPNVCVPLAAMMDCYKTKGYEFRFQFYGTNNYVEHTCLNEPLQVETLINSTEMLFPLDKVWKYSSAEGENALVTAIVNAIRETINS